MITLHHIGTTLIGIRAIPEGARLSRREREKEAVRRILAEMGLDPEMLQHDEHGAPAIAGHAISITHSQRLAAVAIAPTGEKIGIDAEEERDALHKVKHKFLNHEEMGRLADGYDLLAAWTIKEAVYKAAGIPGLSMTEISTAPTLEQAQAAGAGYKISFIAIGPTLIAVAHALIRQ